MTKIKKNKIVVYEGKDACWHLYFLAKNGRKYGHDYDKKAYAVRSAKKILSYMNADEWEVKVHYANDPAI